jgi:DNA-binding transcriptional MerR regulator
MNNTKTLEVESGYRIGAVARLTGVSPHTLRVWERRYGTVTPYRSEAGTRLYTQSDVDRLVLIKRLVDRGDTISLVANLPQKTLEQRCSGADLPQNQSEVGRACRVVVLGAALTHSLEGASFEDSEVEVLGCFRDREDLVGQVGGLEPDLLVLEHATIQPQQIREIGALWTHPIQTPRSNRCLLKQSR